MSRAYFKWIAGFEKVASERSILIRDISCYLMVLSGTASEDVVKIIVGATLAFAGTSVHLTS